MEIITEEDLVIDVRLVELVDKILSVEWLDAVRANVDDVIVTQMETAPTLEPISLQANIKLALELTHDAQHGYVFKNLKTGSLISIEQLCNDNYIPIFSYYHLKILKNQQDYNNRKENVQWVVLHTIKANNKP